MACVTYTTEQEEDLLLNTQIDEGFGDVNESSSIVTTCTMDQDEHPITIAPPADPESDEDEVIIIVTYSTIIVANYAMVCNAYLTYMYMYIYS